MEFSDTFVVQSNEDFYRENGQAWIDGFFDNSTLVRTIQEEIYPFNQVYEEYETHVDTISEFTVNTTKVEGDYLSLIYRDCSHETYRGQKVIYEDKPYLIYQKTEPLSRVARTKIIKCNNKIKFIDKLTGTIITEPIFVGFELSATNNNVTKDATVDSRRLICLIQGNKYTSEFIEEQRFMLSKKKAFKITQIGDINKDDIDEEYPTMITLYIEWSPVSANDSKDLLIADYYDSLYTLSINSTNLSLSPSSIGQLTSTVKLNDVIQSNIPLKWSTSNSSVVKIDSLGNYQVVGLDGTMAAITCSIDGNETIFDTISLDVVTTPIVDKQIVINPTSVSRLLQGKSVDINYGVYDGDTLTSDVIVVTPSGANSTNYNLTYSSGKVTVTNLLKTTTPLVLTFTSGSLTSKTISITLGGIM
jgi:hypothetical protein